MKKTMLPAVSAVLTLALTLSSSVALAQTPAAAAPAAAAKVDACGKGYSDNVAGEQRTVTFCDDLGDGSSHTPMIDVIRRPPGALRLGLIRPRVQFISEMLKSVENL
ncbi:MAG: hypothetical protein HOO96_01025 [Polyangiaceae bacterium]|nr:hypothetical protein [Polyangiaceae bacterium]